MTLTDIVRYEEELRYLRRVRDEFPLAAIGRTTSYEPPDDVMLVLVADVYFRLNDSYMGARRPQPGHWSRPEKIAAVSTLAVMLVHPIETAREDVNAFYLNPLFALRCGFNRLGARFADIDLRTVQRMAGWLDKFRVASADQALDVLHAARTAAPDHPFPIEEDDAKMPLRNNELFDIDMLVSFYDVLKRYVDHLRPRDAIG